MSTCTHEDLLTSPPATYLEAATFGRVTQDPRGSFVPVERHVKVSLHDARTLGIHARHRAPLPVASPRVLQGGTGCLGRYVLGASARSAPRFAPRFVQWLHVPLSNVPSGYAVPRTSPPPSRNQRGYFTPLLGGTPLASFRRVVQIPCEIVTP